ncbi:MAG: lysophospholipid acyltransferase family protein [Eubacteriales bacterium]
MKKEKSLCYDKGRLEVIEKIRQNEIAGGENFFNDVEPDPPSRPILPNEVDYLNKRFSSKVKTFFAVIIEKICEKIFKKKFDITVLGAENIQGVEAGAIITSNHFAPTENLAVKIVSEKAPKKRKLYKVVREGNFFMKGIIGFLLKNCRTLPLSSNIHTMKLLDNAVETILKNGDFILIYPEQAMWWNYRKPRPYRIGAYHFAAKYNVPVVPCFVTLSRKGTTGKNGFPDVKYTIHVMQPLYPDPQKTVRENAEAMRAENARMCKEKYEEVYKTPLTYGDYSLNTAFDF